MVTRIEKSPPPGTPGEDGQAGDHATLDSIALEGAKLDGPKPADQKAEQQVLASDAEEIHGALQALRDAALPFAPPHVQDPLAMVWSDKQLLDVARALVAVARLHGITVGKLLEGYGPYLSLAMALGIPTITTLKILRIPPPAQHVERVPDGQP